MTYLILRLHDETFAIDAEVVRSIVERIPVTDVPGAPLAASGLINVRGRIVPLADLRVIFDLPRPEPDENTRFVVLEIDVAGEQIAIAIIADKVVGVGEFEAADMLPPPNSGMRWPTEYVRGVFVREDDFIIIPSLEAIFNAIESAGSFIEKERVLP
ncbi:hypothetical protein B2G71_08330 [Novosphingobium sp. PC22D]|uniref:chemotaxis protein CheW n=1 Tax=Novosphingobium sp. PC22D TaxID=1962403 RepID=UPI000BF21B13|nr:chemotaxis protein CheW [Novosphingobium sp. PC22D]PEQ13421.1 hypothetical protein B2G71_08330 [Novosphingobium sp. PC22D]